MSEETTNDGTWGGLKKTIIGTLSTAVLGAGTWFTTTFFNAEPEVKEETKTEQAAPAAAPVVINLSNNNEQKQSAAPTTIIRERVVEKPAAAPVKKKEGDEFKEADPKW
jgi:hypothetical protein